MTTGPVPAGSVLLAEFDAASQWYNASITIAAGWLSTGGKVNYYAFAHPPESIRNRLTRLGIDVERLEKNGALEIWDWYTTTLGVVDRLSKGEKFSDIAREVSMDSGSGKRAGDLLGSREGGW